MDLSIIIPVHNLENHILPLLVSLKLQVKSWKTELIFVCDNCTDKTKDIIETFDFSNTYETIKVIECDVRSCGLARNVGFKSAEGEYIWFVDGDDWLTSPYAITTVLMNVKKFGPVIQFDYEAPGFGAKGHPAMVWQYCYKKSFIDDIAFGPEQPHEDLHFNQKVLARLGNRINHMPMTIYHYNYMRPGSNIQQLTTKGVIEQ